MPSASIDDGALHDITTRQRYAARLCRDCRHAAGSRAGVSASRQCHDAAAKDLYAASLLDVRRIFSPPSHHADIFGWLMMIDAGGVAW